jgi:hypothetical protein
MAENTSEDDNVKILQPDMSLKEKLGPSASFDQVVKPQTIAAAEDVIAKSSTEILASLLNELDRLQHAVLRLHTGQQAEPTLKAVIEAAFAIKSNAGLCGYTFASSLAKSLHTYCELDEVYKQPLTEKSLGIIRTQVGGLKAIFTNKMTGDGGKVGAAILSELQKLSANP